MVHIGELRDSTLVAYPLAPNRRILCASPAYLARHGAPAKLEDLREHDCIALRENDEDVTLWRFKKGGARRSVCVSRLCFPATRARRRCNGRWTARA